MLREPKEGGCMERMPDRSCGLWLTDQANLTHASQEDGKGK